MARKERTDNDKKFRKVTGCIGVGLIVLVVLMQSVIFEVPFIIEEIVGHFDPRLGHIASLISDMVLYLLSFMVPAWMIRAMLKKRGLLSSMKLEFKLTRGSLLLVPAGIAIGLAASVLNSYLVQIFASPEATNSLMGETYPYEAYEIVLLLISTALVPAVCEEYLFRGAIAANLMPFGKGVAVIGSSVLFAFMHQTPFQLFYTLIAGLFLGYLYVKTGSILCGTILHFCNNALSVLFDVFNANLGDDIGMKYYYITMGVVYLLGIISIAAYFYIEKKSKVGRFDEGSFGKLIETESGYAEMPVTRGRTLGHFLTPTMIVYFCLASLNIVFLAAYMALI